MNRYKRQLSSWHQPDFIAKELIKIWGEDGLIWLDGDQSALGRWIKLAVDPIEQVCCRGLPENKDGSNPFEELRRLKPGHWTGWLSYEAAAWIEPSNPWRSDNMATLWMASHDPIFKFDLQEKQLWLEGCNEKRFQDFWNWLENLTKQNPPNKKGHTITQSDKTTKIPIHSWQWLTSKIKYSKNVNIIKEWIEKGDLFQANLATCCTTNLPKHNSALQIYLKLRQYSPAPFSGLVIGQGETQNEAIISVSPERFLKVWPRGEIETRPIKGTRPRDSNPQKDADLAISLVCSKKDRAENIMIVDILRNDLGKVCQPGSIQVSQLVGLESYPQVHHLTSVIRGNLNTDKTWVDLLEACWPGGSISGAPKLRACQRLYEIEGISRGPYCGSLINLDWDGTLDSSILIRTILKKNLMLKAYAGCGIVADSNPNNEAEEMKWKLLPLLKALE